jgi:hypothetical protein
MRATAVTECSRRCRQCTFEPQQSSLAATGIHVPDPMRAAARSNAARVQPRRCAAVFLPSTAFRGLEPHGYRYSTAARSMIGEQGQAESRADVAAVIARNRLHCLVCGTPRRDCDVPSPPAPLPRGGRGEQRSPRPIMASLRVVAHGAAKHIGEFRGQHT